MRRARYDRKDNKFYLTFPFADEDARWEVRRIEGRLWHPKLKAWSVPACLRAWESLKAIGFKMVGFGGGQDYVKWLEAGCPAPVSAPPQGDDLRPYQRDAVEWLKRRQRALLGDKPGLGKTHVATEWARSSPSVVVVCPKVVIPQWIDIARRRLGIEMQYALKGIIPEEGWFVTNPERLGKLEPPPGMTLIVDEAHFYRNIKAARTKQLLQWAATAHKVLAMTGTYLTRQPVRLWPLYVMLKEREPKQFFPWAQRYCDAEQTDFGWNFGGASNLEELAKDMRHFTIARTKEEVFKDLPSKQYTTFTLDADRQTVKGLRAMDDLLLQMIEQGVDFRSGAGFDMVQRLRMDSARAKVQMTAEWCVSQGLPDTKIVVMGEFIDPLLEVGNTIGHLTGGECEVVYAMGNSDRAEAKHRFINDPKVGVICGTFGAMGVGMDGLQSVSSTMVIHDLPWTPDALEQGEDRLHRSGQQGAVHIVTMLAGTVIEARMLEGLRHSKDIIEAIQQAT